MLPTCSLSLDLQGDFRFEDVPFSSLSALHSSTTLQPLKLDEVYLDTTFCHPQYLTFPKRDEAMKCIWELVHGWIREGYEFWLNFVYQSNDLLFGLRMAKWIHFQLKTFIQIATKNFCHRKNGMYRNHRAKHVVLLHLPG
jgi:hypothetical protein